MKKNILSVILLIGSIAIAAAATLSGTGSGDSEDSAKSMALEDLTWKISVNVSSQVVDFTEEGGVDKSSSAAEYSANLVKTSSEMSVLGASFDTTWKPAKSGGRIYTCTVTMDTERSLPLYEKKIKELAGKINDGITSAKKKKDKAKEDILNSIITDMKEYEKYKTPALYLGITDLPALSLSEAEVLDELRQTQEMAYSLEYAGSLIGKKIKKYKNILVCPIMPDGIDEATDLSVTLRTNIQQHCLYTSKCEQAQYFLRGHYTALNDGKNGISVVCNLKDKTDKNLLTVSVKLSPECYVDINFIPKTTNFNQMMKNGVLLPDTFRAQLRTNKDSGDPFFTSNETVKIFVKLNQAGYYYIQGYVLKDEEEFSYLVEMNEGMGNRKFIGYINHDDANKWIELGEFSVEPPYGSEFLHLIASTADFKELPAVHYDESSGYYIVGNSVSEAIQATRGLQKIKKPDEILSAEDKLMFTTAK